MDGWPLPSFRLSTVLILSIIWKTCWLFMNAPTMNDFPLFAWMNHPNNSLESPNTDQPTEHELKILTGPPVRYIRHGVGEIYMAFEPLASQRFMEVTDDHKAITWIGILAGLLDGPYAKCLKMKVVGDNLSAHKPSAFYLVFGAEKAKSYLDRLEFVYTPKHGSWLDMAEIEPRGRPRIHFATGLSESAHCHQRVVGG